MFAYGGTSEKDAPTINMQIAAFETKREQIVQAMLSGTYQPQAILGVEIPKENGKKRLLGISKLLSYYFIAVSCRNRFPFTNIR